MNHAKELTELEYLRGLRPPHPHSASLSASDLCARLLDCLTVIFLPQVKRTIKEGVVRIIQINSK